MSRDSFEERAVKSLLDLAVLSLLVDEPKHGYAVIRELSKRTGVMVGAGIIYPLLYELEDQEFITGSWTSPERRTRKLYSITSTGKKHLENGYRAVDRTLQEIKSLAKV